MPGAAAIAVVGVVTVLRLLTLYLSGNELYGDEAQYWAYGMELDTGYYSKPPMVAWIIAAATAVCGHGEFCIRLASPVLQGLTALVLYALGRDLFGARVGFWSAVVYATLPGVSFLSGLMVTDGPLLLFWAAALLAFCRILGGPAGLTGGRTAHGGTMTWALVLGLALGLGILSKYAMAYFALCAGLALVACPAARWFATSRQLIVALVLAFVVISPNLVWNAQHGWATVAHVSDNAKLGAGPSLHVDDGLEFFGSQFGIFGPVLFAVLLWRLWRWRDGGPAAERLLLLFTVPVIALITVQAFVSRAHANWAAVSYVAGSVLVTAWVLRLGRQGLVTGSVILHVAAATIFYLGVAAGPAAVAMVPGGDRLLARIQGWRALAAEVGSRVAGRDYTAIVADDRLVLAELMYYGRDLSIPMRIWKRSERPRNQFELTRPLVASEGHRVLFVTKSPDPADVLQRSARVLDRQSVDIPAGSLHRRIQFLTLEDLKPG